jgi:hypothetical protein
MSFGIASGRAPFSALGATNSSPCWGEARPPIDRDGGATVREGVKAYDKNALAYGRATAPALMSGQQRLRKLVVDSSEFTPCRCETAPHRSQGPLFSKKCAKNRHFGKTLALECDIGLREKLFY